MQRIAAALRQDSEILLGQVTAIQEWRQLGHEALSDWGSWSRCANFGVAGAKPQITLSSIFSSVQPDHQEATPLMLPCELGTKRHGGLPSGYQDPLEHDDCADMRRGCTVDQILSDLPDSRAYWRRIARAVYFFMSPHWQWLEEAGLRQPGQFVSGYDAVLQHVQLQLA
jgi:hypothetical protein